MGIVGFILVSLILFLLVCGVYDLCQEPLKASRAAREKRRDAAFLKRLASALNIYYTPQYKDKCGCLHGNATHTEQYLLREMASRGQPDVSLAKTTTGATFTAPQPSTTYTLTMRAGGGGGSAAVEPKKKRARNVPNRR